MTAPADAATLERFLKDGVMIVRLPRLLGDA